MSRLREKIKIAVMTELIHIFKVDASYHLKRKVTGIGIVIHETDKPKKNGIVIDEISELYLDIPSNVQRGRCV